MRNFYPIALFGLLSAIASCSEAKLHQPINGVDPSDRQVDALGQDVNPQGVVIEMFWAKSEDVSRCGSVDPASGGSVEIADLTYSLYHSEGVICATNKDGLLIEVYAPAPRQAATHRWAETNGSDTVPIKRFFGPVADKAS